MMVATNYISIWSQESGRVIMSLWPMMSINQCPSIVFIFMLSRSEDMIKSDREAAKLSKWFCSMMLWLHLAGDRVNMGCNDILMLVAAPLAPLSPWCEHRAPGNWSRSPGMWGLGAETATQIAASETRTVSWNWGPMVPVKGRNTALNMKRPPYTWDLKGNNKWWSWILTI